MPDIDLSKLNMSSHFAGLKNYDNDVDFQVVIPSFSLGAGDFTRHIASTPLDNEDAISHVQIRYEGLQSFWRQFPGYLITNFPIYDTPDYQIQSYKYFTGGVLYVDTYIANQAGVSVLIPDIIVRAKASLYLAPFN